MKTIAVPRNRAIVLPRGLFRPLEKVAIFIEGNMLIIKKLEPSRLSSIALRTKGRPVPLRTIVREVHAYRRAKRAP